MALRKFIQRYVKYTVTVKKDTITHIYLIFNFVPENLLIEFIYNIVYPLYIHLSHLLT